MAAREIVPYHCVYIDCVYADFMSAVTRCASAGMSRKEAIARLKQLWIRPHNMNPAVPFLSVRSAFYTYLDIMKFPVGSEIIVSAINIPDMTRIVHHFGLKIVSLDITIDTLAPKEDLLEDLLSDRTKALLLAHIYGKVFDMTPFVAFAKKHNLAIIEDCAECFDGFQYLGHPESDIALFSFGAIKYYTSFGGAIAKVKNTDLSSKMESRHSSFPVQDRATYLKKILKYSIVYPPLNVPWFSYCVVVTTRWLGIDHKKWAVGNLRGFPTDLISGIRAQPCTPLLVMMAERLSQVDLKDMQLTLLKGNYVSDRLPVGVTQLGLKAYRKGYWLYPVIVDNADEVSKTLFALGVDAYRGASQLNLVEPDNGNNHLKQLHTFATRYPHEAKYIIDHVLYLPVNKLVPYRELNRICECVEAAVAATSSKRLRPLTAPKIQSRL